MDKDFFQYSKMWKSKNGKYIQLKDMTDSYLINALHYCFYKSDSTHEYVSERFKREAITFCGYSDPDEYDTVPAAIFRGFYVANEHYIVSDTVPYLIEEIRKRNLEFSSKYRKAVDSNNFVTINEKLHELPSYNMNRFPNPKMLGIYKWYNWAYKLPENFIGKYQIQIKKNFEAINEQFLWRTVELDWRSFLTRRIPFSKIVVEGESIFNKLILDLDLNLDLNLTPIYVKAQSFFQVEPIYERYAISGVGYFYNNQLQLYLNVNSLSSFDKFDIYGIRIE